MTNEALLTLGMLSATGFYKEPDDYCLLWNFPMMLVDTACVIVNILLEAVCKLYVALSFFLTTRPARADPNKNKAPGNGTTCG